MVVSLLVSLPSLKWGFTNERSIIWVWVKIKPPAIGPQAFGSIYQGLRHFGVAAFLTHSHIPQIFPFLAVLSITFLAHER